MLKICVGCNQPFPVSRLSRCPKCYAAYRSSLKPEGSHWQWSKIRAAVLAAEPLCRVCKKPAAVVDHIISRRDGGGDEPSNLQPLCHKCHTAKTRGY